MRHSFASRLQTCTTPVGEPLDIFTASSAISSQSLIFSTLDSADHSAAAKRRSIVAPSSTNLFCDAGRFSCKRLTLQHAVHYQNATQPRSRSRGEPDVSGDEATR